MTRTLVLGHVAIEAVGNGRKVFRVAVDSQAFCTVATEAIVVRSPLGVIHDKQIEQAIIVVVEPTGRDGPLVAANA